MLRSSTNPVSKIWKKIGSQNFDFGRQKCENSNYCVFKSYWNYMYLVYALIRPNYWHFHAKNLKWIHYKPDFCQMLEKLTLFNDKKQ